MSSLEGNKIVGALLFTALAAMAVSTIGNALIPQYHVKHEKATEAKDAGDQQPQTQEPEKPLPELLAAATPEAGQKIAQKCVSCHTFDKGGPNKVGPNLYDVVGRKPAAVAGYPYSDAMKNLKDDWDYEHLYKYLANPSTYAKGTKMTFRLAKSDERANVIVYLRTLSESPKPLPAKP